MLGLIRVVLRSWHRMYMALIIASGLSAISAFAEELTQEMLGVRAPQIVQLAVGGSIIIDSPTPIGRASLANPDVASTIVLSPTQIYLTGKTIGTTTLTLWDQRKSLSRVYTVQVIPDLTRLKRQLHEVFPNEQKVRITAGHDNVALSGTVSSTEVLGKILAMAEPYAPQKVVNLLQVGGVQQVMLEVHIAEMNRQLARRLGINFSRLRAGNNFFFGELNDLSELTLKDGPSELTVKDGAFEFVASAIVNATLGIPAGKDLYLIFLDFLKQHNLSRVLAEPTLVAISGQEAEFLAGGEFPIPVPQAFGVTTIKFKEFGVRLGFKPTVLHDGKISLKITPEVSELDFANGVNSQGFTIPAITTRRASTVLELSDGQSFAIAGLLQDNIRETIAKYPVLGDIPILGTLFRSTQFQKNETELIIIVTPRLVKPLDLAHQTLPTDSYLEPNDFELMLLGYLEGVPHVPRTDGVSGTRSETGPLTWHQGGLEGPFGHLAPEMTDMTMGRSP